MFVVFVGHLMGGEGVYMCEEGGEGGRVCTYVRREGRKGVYMCEEGEWGINEEGRERKVGREQITW